MIVPAVSVNDFSARLGIDYTFKYPETSLNKSLKNWQMEEDDSPIFRHIYRSFRPKRHLEFGTWYGLGALYCLQECDATVWTLNLPWGEKDEHGKWAYPQQNQQHFWDILKKTMLRPSDELGSIGRYYLELGLGNRVCQIYCDSRDWDIQNYPDGFFDTALVDGGHSEEVVSSDTKKACQLVRSGGIIMWHDFCEENDVLSNCSSPRGVVSAIHQNWNWLKTQMEDIFWIEPSWILLGIKK